MNNVKLTDEQIIELQRLFLEGFRFLYYEDYCEKTLAYKHCPSLSSSNLSLSSTYVYDDLFFLEGEEPFYFGDLFEVVYKGEVE